MNCCTCDPKDLCVEKDGDCECEPCQCQNGDVAEEGKW